MITAEGCRQRRFRLLQNLDPKPPSDHLRLTDPIHLAYLANFHVDPISSSADFGGFLIVRKDGHALLIHDKRMSHDGDSAFVDERKVVPWYDGQSPGIGHIGRAASHRRTRRRQRRDMDMMIVQPRKQ